MSGRAWALFALALLPSGLLRAGNEIQPDPVAWLNRIADAGRQLTYSGTFIYQYGKYIETSRIVHIHDADGEHEKVETLDGPVREIVRKNDDIFCFLPESKTVKLDKSHWRRFFPSLLVGSGTALAENYEPKVDGLDRVAGYDCQVLILKPKDRWRFGHRLCANVAFGLLLKATMYNEKNETLEQFVFTQLIMGKQVDPESVKSIYEANRPGWRKDTSALDAKTTESGWTVGNPPPGFRKIMEMKRNLSGKASPLYHLVYSDGLAAVSVFIEPARAAAGTTQGSSQQGAVNYYLKDIEGYQVTVLGEVPAASVVQMGDSVGLRVPQ
jgi:sigma-E factor negative regulatory protein RseB